jgi:hypothetical protein
MGFVIEIIKQILPAPNNAFTSFKNMEKDVQGYDVPMCTHYFCSKCEKLVPEDKSKVITCPRCHLEAPQAKFCTFSITSQAKTIMSRPEILAALKANRKRLCNSGQLQDICCGSCYKNNEAYFKDWTNLSFSWNTDGSDKFKSVEFTMWPILLKFNDLPPHLR